MSICEAYYIFYGEDLSFPKMILVDLWPLFELKLLNYEPLIIKDQPIYKVQRKSCLFWQ